jgi:pyruvate dehydrogenase E2 component (dihydrolipoamide acetyltransferase)
MSLEFKLPEVSEGVTSVDVAEVRVKEGDVIASGAIICEVETDKAVAEIACPHAGTITKILIKSGDKINVGQPILLMETSGASAPAAPAAKPAPVAAAPAPAPVAAAPAPAANAAPASAVVASGPVDFRLPEVSEGVTKVDVASVAVKVGDTIASGAVVCEVETDKAVAEITCPHAGTITAVHVKPGISIPIGELLLTINATSGASAPTTSSAPSPAAPVAPAVAAAPVASTQAAAPAAKVASPSAPAPAVTGSKSDGPPAAAGPATRRLARKLGVNLKLVKGSAAGGRVTIEDVEAFVRDRMAQPAATSTAGAPGFGVVQAQPLPDFSKYGPVEKVAMSKIFRVSAANLSNAWVTIPHVTQHDLADITELESARKRYVKANPNSPKITMTAIMIKAVVGALKAYPNFNSSVDMVTGELVLKQYYHIGVAVDTPNGLVVPVIRNCDQKNVLQVAAELTDIAGRARDRKLKTEEMQGGSFTITTLAASAGQRLLRL